MPPPSPPPELNGARSFCYTQPYEPSSFKLHGKQCFPRLTSLVRDLHRFILSQVLSAGRRAGLNAAGSGPASGIVGHVWFGSSL